MTRTNKKLGKINSVTVLFLSNVTHICPARQFTMISSVTDIIFFLFISNLESI